ncbi:uncharacterized protein METZ01_LOCUS256901 [marine metagenome]|uniref:Uncharacterized protein n=1 Tax=marine metagenome TaxID=408172 RepID=A0A382IY38_9ZZZZ
MYFGVSFGNFPACNQGHIGGKINILPFLQGETTLSSFIQISVSPAVLLSRYKNMTRNLLASS